MNSLNPFERGPIYKIKTIRRRCPICHGERYRYGRTCPDCRRNAVAEMQERAKAQAQTQAKEQKGAKP